MAEPHRTADDGVEDGLQVGGRAADDTQNLRRCRLLFQHLGKPSMHVCQLPHHDEAHQDRQYHAQDQEHSRTQHGVVNIGFAQAARQQCCANQDDKEDDILSEEAAPKLI
jgi:hypothetical protein